MKRLHIHIGVEDLDAGIRFYTALFGAKPLKIEADYAKWMLDDPRVNFAISTRASKKGVDHLGIQADENDELAEIRARVKAAGMAVFDEGETVCCYAKSDKSWLQDPAGVPWEAYRTMEDARMFASKAAAGENACCAERPAVEEPCCEAKGAGCCQ
ncbi:MAG TPA: ArsI/CadI family heavy metal resistance metalloenzyme [Verrucomicrobiae bacterium]|jgi:catechol 2,3-dioxygenase-like lactoylglutathione lyase family enzyme|nr:ArsI/CadI family heavy metal resistance metalloenzyme [Verrucomicrobiae bacterium]